MWLSRHFFLVGFCLVSASCGYQPIYGRSGSANHLEANVSIEAPSDRAGYVLYHQLNKRLKDADDGEYKLSFDISETSSRAAIGENGRAHRALLEGFATYDLSRSRDDKTVISGRVQGFTGYSTLATSVASDASSRDATQRLMTMLADKIIYELFFAADRGDFETSSQ